MTTLSDPDPAASETSCLLLDFPLDRRQDFMHRALWHELFRDVSTSALSLSDPA